MEMDKDKFKAELRVQDPELSERCADAHVAMMEAVYVMLEEKGVSYTIRAVNSLDFAIKYQAMTASGSEPT